MRTQTSPHKKPLNMVRIIKAPIKAISKAIDLYVKSVTNFSIAYNRPRRAIEESVPIPDNDQSSEGALIRSITIDAMDGKASNIKITDFEMYIIHHHCHKLQSGASRKGTPRSYNVGLEKIDEDRVSSFKDDNIFLKGW
ncbi:hypothetical protein HanXRQr2_Chr14g0664191 [Helianthus annuus]|uniref:Uncharacterized protein n=1 Tax=Helianthus annuus TaxID=4232 RepID=A0A9K3ECV8_HELAN|nr:hypothetical protein HanXRQr2_Chr14g0664191 [Helianthus annuus]KAJ0959632.1 hypothetical protein HanPSC8_Chr00c011g0800471 [Helianthus annuus]